LKKQEPARSVYDGCERDTAALESLKMAAVVVSALPVLVLYPFLLRYFEKGTMIASVKG